MSHAPYEEAFLQAAQSLAEDRFFAVPMEVHSAIARHGRNLKAVLLGTHGLGSHLLDVPPCDRHCDIIAVIDDVLGKTQASYCGVPLASSERLLQLARDHDGLVAINTCRNEAPRRYFDQLCAAHGISHMNYEQAVRALGLHGRVDWRVDDWGPQIILDVERYRQLALRFDDELSARTLYAVLHFHLSCETDLIREIALCYRDLYFRSGLLTFDQREKMVDCGASIGESLHGLIATTGGEFERSWMIEPDRENIRTLRTQLDRLPHGLASRISLHACAVGDATRRVPFRHGGGHGGAVLADGKDLADADMIDVLPVDQIVDDAPTFIKMDVEGSELDALKGARHTIETHRPKLALSAYHRAGDPLALSDYVLARNPGYRVGLRHHTAYRWDTCLYFY